MRKLLFLLATLVILPLTAKIKPFDKEQYKRAETRFNEVTGTGDPKAIKTLADSLRDAGRKTNNYAVGMLYYDAMALYHYYACHSEEEMVKRITTNYSEGMQFAKEQGSEQHYWQFYHAKIINQLYVSSSECLEQAEAMLQEVENEHSDYGMLYAHYTLSFIYNYRNEMMMAIDVLRKAVKTVEKKNVAEDELLARGCCDLIYMSLADNLYQQTLYDEALSMTDKMEAFIKSCPSFKEQEKQVRMMDIYAMRAVIYFDQWKYDEFDKQVALMKQDPDYENFIMAANKIQVYFYILMREGREMEVQQFLSSLEAEDEQHQYRFYYYRYHNRTREAILEDEMGRLLHDSLKYQIHTQDMASIDAKMGNVQLREEKLRLEAQQFKVKAWATGGVLLVIVISVSILLIRHRRHAKQLLEKNVQLSLARDEAEKQRAEAVEQRGIAEEQRNIAEEQRNIAEEQRNIAEEQKAEAVEQRAIAVEQRAIAEAQRAEAEAQRAEAETQRAEAERQKSIAEEQRAEAETQRNIAEEQRAEAETQRAEAETQRNIAEEQRAEAENQRAEAENQRAEAERQKDIAEEQRGIAEEQRSIAEEQRGIAVKAQKVAERANEMKSEFILSMMHEIRTPLNHIKGFSSIIADPNMQGETDMMQEASTQINNSTNHLTHLLDDILQLGKFDSMVDVEKANANVMELLLTAMMNSPQPDASAVEMIPAIEEVDPCLDISTNMDMAQKAFSALINNAVKFTKQGQIKLGIETDDENEIRFYIEDTGPGIPAGQEERIFERFVKLDEFVPGTGLGLSMADAIVKVLGGRVYVDTTYPGPGARFVMALPRQ